MYAVRAGKGDISEETSGQLALDVEVILLDISILGVGMGCQRRRAVRGDEGRKVGLRIASGRQKNPPRTERATCIGAREIEKGAIRYICQRTIGSVQGTERSQIRVCRSVEARGGQIHNIIVGIQSKRYVVWNIESAEATANHCFLIERVGESQTWGERLLIHMDIGASR